jgi:hypothetical protein
VGMDQDRCGSLAEISTSKDVPLLYPSARQLLNCHSSQTPSNSIIRRRKALHGEALSKNLMKPPKRREELQAAEKLVVCLPLTENKIRLGHIIRATSSMGEILKDHICTLCDLHGAAELEGLQVLFILVRRVPHIGRVVPASERTGAIPTSTLQLVDVGPMYFNLSNPNDSFF